MAEKRSIVSSTLNIYLPVSVYKNMNKILHIFSKTEDWEQSTFLHLVLVLVLWARVKRLQVLHYSVVYIL